MTMDLYAETDGCCRQRAKQSGSLSWINPSDLASSIDIYLVLDIRSFSLFCGKHIQSAQSLSFSPILLRRLVKGSVKLDSLITDERLLNSIANSKQIVLYDQSSTPVNTKPELVKLAETLMSRFDYLSVKLLLGGMETFQSTYPTLCGSEDPTKALSPSKITLDTAIVSAKPSEADVPEGTPVEILPYLFLGSAKDSADLRILQKFKITSVLNITTSCPNHFESFLEYLSLPVEDSHQTDILSKLQLAISFIDDVQRRGGKVFVHCHAGISRSATVCIAYLMKNQKLTVDQAYKFVQSKRPIISPNLGFMGQLMAYQKSLQKTWSITKTTTTLTDSCVPSTCTVTRYEPTHNPKATSSLVSSDVHSRKLGASIPPSLKASGRSVSVPVDVHTRSGAVRKKSREGLRLSFNSDLDKMKNATQISPCRVEARDLTLSLNLSTTCT